MAYLSQKDLMWRKPPQAFPLLSKEAVHVWSAELSDSVTLEQDWQLLAEEERQRAGRLISDYARTSFIKSRAILRRLLAYYTKLSPQNIVFCYSEYGKPYLPNQRIHFNVSHSYHKVVYAFSLDFPVGIDVEYTKRIPFKNLAKRYFSHNEYLALMALPAEEQMLAFYRCWTFKEAFIKSRGQGVFQLMRHFEVRFTSNQPDKLLPLNNAASLPAEVLFYDLSFDSHYPIALVVQGSPKEILCWKWSGGMVARFI